MNESNEKSFLKALEIELQSGDIPYENYVKSCKACGINPMDPTTFDSFKKDLSEKTS